MAHKKDIELAFVHLARMALEGRIDDVAMIARQTLRTISQQRPDLANDAIKLIALANNTPARSITHGNPLPVDSESRLELVKREDDVFLTSEPIWPDEVARELDAVIKERRNEESLHDAGLLPTRSLLLVGPPGVGKTLAARWLAKELARPLLTLDLAAVMSSFLGKTGNNIRVVLDHAKRYPSVLLLDEFDAIAKRRDDSAEVGELKRLVTVLLQSVDEWPANGLLIAATNHPELLDPAVWRRFERIVKFPLPNCKEIERTIASLIGRSDEKQIDLRLTTLASIFEGKSFAEINREIVQAKRSAVLNGNDYQELLLQLVMSSVGDSDLETRIRAARSLQLGGFSQRHISKITGLARDTIRKYRENKNKLGVKRG